MGAIKHMFVLIVVYFELSRCATGRKLNPGDTFTKTCRITDSDNINNVQIYKDEYSIKMFTVTHSFQKYVFSNGTDIREILTNWTDRYSIANLGNGQLRFTITNITQYDSGPYGCQLLSSHTDGFVITKRLMGVLEVEAPVLALYWTTNTSLPSPLVTNPSFALPNNATVTLDLLRIFGRVELYCVVITTITEPVINITYGKYGNAGSETVKIGPNPGAKSRVEFGHGGFITIQTATRFLPKLNYKKPNEGEGKPLYCRAETSSGILEKSVVPVVRRKPYKGFQCDPFDIKARIGQKDVSLTCRIKLYPLVNVTWTLVSNGSVEIDDKSTVSGYKMDTRVIALDTVETKLIIKELKYADFGRYRLNIENEFGSTYTHIYLQEGFTSVGNVLRSSLRSALLLGVMVIALNFIDVLQSFIKEFGKH